MALSYENLLPGVQLYQQRKIDIRLCRVVNEFCYFAALFGSAGVSVCIMLCVNLVQFLL